jgi:broad specificity phosphatase PhoE
MSTLLLIRHGQAAAYAPDSDRLTELGEAQARRVAEHLLEEGWTADEVRSGTLERQRRTRDIVADAFKAAGRPWPDAVEDDGWNEYDAPGVLGRALPALAARDASFRALVEAFQENAGSADRNSHFQRMFEVLMDRWQMGDVPLEGVEPFDAFHGRVSRAFGSVIEQGGSRTVLAFTSGGPIGVSVQSVLGAPPAASLRLNWRVRNGSLTEFLFSRGRVSLESFNAVGHFTRALRTFR